MTEPIMSMRMVKAVVLFGWRKSQILNFEIALLFVDGFKLLKAIQLFRYPTNIYVCSFYWTSMANVCVCALAALLVSSIFILFFLFLFLTLENFYCCGFVHCVLESLKRWFDLHLLANLYTPFLSWWWWLWWRSNTDKKNNFFVVSQQMTIDDPCPILFISSLFYLLFVQKAGNDRIVGHGALTLPFTVDLTIIFVYWHSFLIDKLNLFSSMFFSFVFEFFAHPKMFWRHFRR